MPKYTKAVTRSLECIHNISPDGLGKFEVFCDEKTASGGWTVLQKRLDSSAVGMITNAVLVI